ncbi:vWA domain-containing protein [Haloglomus litoreum]|uniref:vWA domain-containing protein n=1 Tax=Haloglomus litoreum TaxID=3034026 RepID=UPI0023E7E75D|nr:vWA domain-containing protein [Haloglomus sp. DT116]
MSDRQMDITRRKVLGALGAVGAAGAGAGFGTSALFNDTESFEENVITAGELDLKVDWEEHYSYPQAVGFGDPTDGLTVTRSEPEDTSNYVGLPYPTDPVLWVHEDNLDAYMANTAIEAFPDFDGDGTQDAGSVEEDYVPCRDGADTPDDLDPTGNRTDNADTKLDDGSTAPLVNLGDVKPGDFGELTLSFHLCDNPGWVWLQGGNLSESENGETEPEGEVDDSPGGELAENIKTVWWYDTDGDNVLDTTRGKLDVMVLLDRSGSLNSSEYNSLRSAGNTLVDDLLGAGDVEVGGITFGDSDGVSVTSTLGSSSFDFPSGTPNGGNNTPMPPALDIADQHLDNAGRAGAEQVIVLLTDGGPNYVNTTYTSSGAASLTAPRANNWSADAGDQAYDNATNSKDGTVSSGELDETELVADNIKTPSGDSTDDPSRIVTVGIGDPQNVAGTTLDEFLRDRVASSPANHYNANFSNLADVVNDVVAGVALGEEVFHTGTLASDLSTLSSGGGIPLDGDLVTDFDEVAGTGNRECFQPSTTHYIGFGWWLPATVGNEIQSDSVTFDLGFYTEQCRHNPTPDAPTDGV